MKKCKVCKKEFSPKQNQKCCSSACSKINDRNRMNIYRQEHLIELKEYLKQYNITHEEHIKNKRKEYFKTHSKEIKKTNRIYQQNHRKEANIYHSNRIKIDANFKLRCNLSKRIWNALKGICKSKSTVKLLGCDIEFLRCYLESKFIDGMSWENYGKWHVDHVIPCVSFDLSKPEEQQKCFHFTNLQPLWAIDNFIKNRFR